MPKRKAELRLMQQPRVTQDEIAKLNGLSNQIRWLIKQREELAGNVFHRINRGAEVEPGPLAAEIGEFSECAGERRVLLIDGRPVCGE